MANIANLPHELIELIVELSDDKSSLYLLMVIGSPILKRQVYLKNKFTRLEDLDFLVMYRLPNGDLHREYDLPAAIYSDGTQMWIYNNKYHRGSMSDPSDKPAVIHSDGTQSWYFNGKRHREGDKPALIYSDGTQEWFYNGKRYYGNRSTVHVP